MLRLNSDTPSRREPSRELVMRHLPVEWRAIRCEEPICPMAGRRCRTADQYIGAHLNRPTVYLALRSVRRLNMTPKNDDLIKDDSEGPLEDQPLAWSDEDRELEGRKPDLGEIDDDPSSI